MEPENILRNAENTLETGNHLVEFVQRYSHITKMAAKYPNDSEFGAHVREFLSDKSKSKGMDTLLKENNK